MKLTNEQMFNSIVVLQNLRETGRLGYAIARNRRKLIDESKEYMDIREEILKKYGNENGEGQYYIPKEKTADFSNEISEYSGIEHDVDVFQVSEDEFMSGDLDSNQMFTLDWMIAPKKES